MLIIKNVPFFRQHKVKKKGKKATEMEFESRPTGIYT